MLTPSTVRPHSRTQRYARAAHVRYPHARSHAWMQASTSSALRRSSARGSRAAHHAATLTFLLCGTRRSVRPSRRSSTSSRCRSPRTASSPVWRRRGASGGGVAKTRSKTDSTEPTAHSMPRSSRSLPPGCCFETGNRRCPGCHVEKRISIYNENVWLVVYPLGGRADGPMPMLCPTPNTKRKRESAQTRRLLQ